MGDYMSTVHWLQCILCPCNQPTSNLPLAHVIIVNAAWSKVSDSVSSSCYHHLPNHACNSRAFSAEGHYYRSWIDVQLGVGIHVQSELVIQKLLQTWNSMTPFPPWTCNIQCCLIPHCLQRMNEMRTIINTSSLQSSRLEWQFLSHSHHPKWLETEWIPLLWSPKFCLPLLILVA